MSTEPRAYVVGLPVIVTVHEDGQVTYDIDTSEAGSAIRELDAAVLADLGVSSARAEVDAARVDLEHAARALTNHGVVLSPRVRRPRIHAGA